MGRLFPKKNDEKIRSRKVVDDRTIKNLNAGERKNDVYRHHFMKAAVPSKYGDSVLESKRSKQSPCRVPFALHAEGLVAGRAGSTPALRAPGAPLVTTEM
jgi:hypothetical protein